MAKKPLLKFDAGTGEFEDVSRRKLKRKIRKGVIAELATALGMSADELKLRRTIGRLNEARAVGDLQKVAGLQAKAARQLDALEKRAGTDGGAAVSVAAPLGTVVRVGPQILGEQLPASTTTDTGVLRETLRKSLAQPHEGAGGFRT